MHKTRLLKGTKLMTGISLIGIFLEIVYRIALQNMVGADGMALLQPSHAIYILVWFIGVIGLPMPISHMVASRMAKGDRKGAQSVFLICIIAVGTIGLVVCALIWGLSGTIAQHMGLRDAALLLQWAAPCILLYGIIGAFRGYFQGVSLTILSNASMLLDQFVRVLLAILLVGIWRNKEMVDMLSGAVIGMNAGGVAAVLLLGTLYLMGVDQMQNIASPSTQTQIKSKGKIVIRILKQSCMTVVGTGFFLFCVLVDTYFAMDMLAPKKDVHLALTKYGFYNGIVMPMILIGSILATAFFFSTALRLNRVPSKQYGQMVRTATDSLLKKMFLFGSIWMVLLWVLPEGMMHLFYSAGAGENEWAVLIGIIRILSLAAFFAPVAQAALLMMQQAGYEIVTVIITAFVCLLKILVLRVVTPLVGEAVIGIAFSTTVAFAALGILSMAYLLQAIKTELYAPKMLPKIILGAGVSGIVVYLANRFVLMNRMGVTVGTVIALLLGIVVYVFLMISMKVIRMQDFLPTKEKPTTEA